VLVPGLQPVRERVVELAQAQAPVLAVLVLVRLLVQAVPVGQPVAPALVQVAQVLAERPEEALPDGSLR
jgi:hypothetical protein